ncbi:DUF2336 domain-containing protein [Chelatococcus sp. SYSU_G07232]|uniref:DUF2336 domain-containing protein n=1 Tax=Chelatococcus albus TaxID=3047466 RepID=A0ABT7AL98_9HYPH|nr:DUF2336 domain-containing protein [Chelatococcus sp. SYSU_G07232]MDJ1159371.1 DUF2336 domain-containing protein [Chelatococcus sp. SYSU_G07232]
MIVRRYLLWARTATATQRAQGTSALARAYLQAELSPEDRREAETALLAALDDPSPLVRRAMAVALCDAPDAPRALVVGLAGDQSDIAALVLARSPVLTDADLVDCAAVGDALAQTAIALRAELSAPVAAALAEVGAPEALVALAGNPGASIPASALRRMLERHGEDGDLREALLARRDLSAATRQTIAGLVAGRLSAFVTGCGWLSPQRSERVCREAKERAALALAARLDEADTAAFAADLCRSGELTLALLLRAVLSGAVPFAEACFALLADLPLARVGGLIHDRRGAGFPALYRRAGLPRSYLPVFRSAFAAARDIGHGPGGERPALSRAALARVVAECEMLPAAEAAPITALLRRFEAEAAREEAQRLADALADDAALAVIIEHHPEALADMWDEPRALAA